MLSSIDFLQDVHDDFFKQFIDCYGVKFLYVGIPFCKLQESFDIINPFGFFSHYSELLPYLKIANIFEISVLIQIARFSISFGQIASPLLMQA